MFSDIVKNNITVANLKQRRMFNALDPFIESNYTRGLYYLICENVTSSMIIVEVGSFAGVSAQLFATYCQHLYCVDTWDASVGYTIETITLAEEFFDGRCSPFENIKKIKLSSEIAARQFEDESIDMVYIDADHKYDSVKNDMLYWYPKVKMNGYLAGHDYDGGVQLAVDEIKIPDKVYKDMSWIFRKN